MNGINKTSGDRYFRSDNNLDSNADTSSSPRSDRDSRSDCSVTVSSIDTETETSSDSSVLSTESDESDRVSIIRVGGNIITDGGIYPSGTYRYSQKDGVVRIVSYSTSSGSDSSDMKLVNEKSMKTSRQVSEEAIKKNEFQQIGLSAGSSSSSLAEKNSASADSAGSGSMSQTD